MLNTEKVKAMTLKLQYGNTISNLKTILPAQHFILTGSYVLATYGLVSASDVHDLDIILVNPEQTALDNIKNYVKDFPAKTNPPKDNTFCQGIFMYNNVKIDVFVENSFAEPILNIDGIDCTIIPHIIKAKKSYGRMKDWLQCRDMSRLFFKPEEFTSQLNDNWKSLLKDNY